MTDRFPCTDEQPEHIPIDLEEIKAVLRIGVTMPNPFNTPNHGRWCGNCNKRITTDLSSRNNYCPYCDDFPETIIIRA